MARKNSPRRWERSGPSGFVGVDKPQGWTSHDVVDAARRWFGTRQVGHLGTLDPLATGVLPLALRSATKLVPFLEGGEKAYVGTIRLGETTDTLDAEGETLCRHEGPLPDEAAVRAALERVSEAVVSGSFEVEGMLGALLGSTLEEGRPESALVNTIEGDAASAVRCALETALLDLSARR